MQTEEKYDVIVAGGGPGGWAAAVAAARNGAGTLLIERYGFLGGMATAGLVNPFMPFHRQDPDTGEREQIIRGLFDELLGELRLMNALRGASFDEEIIKVVFERMALAAGVTILLHACVAGAQTDVERVVTIETAGKSGTRAFRAGVFIDGTGDGDLAAFAGAPFEIGRPEDGLPQAMTTCFNMADVDTNMLRERGGRRYTDGLYNKAMAAGRFDDVPNDHLRWYVHPRPGVIHFNCTRILRKVGLSEEDLTDAEIECRRQALKIADWLVAEVEPFRNAWLQKLAPQVGIRETRRIMGDYLITADDVLEARPFADAVMRGCYPVDIHSPTGKKCRLTRTRPGGAYEVPYRAICPRKTENLLMACRAISADHIAHAAIRVMPQMIALGQAAGTAAAMALKSGGNVRGVAIGALQDRLIAQGANLLRHAD